ncbi:hypothetical protein ACWEPL_12380 [Nonomuraea sp. NPDC004186]
MTITDHLQGWGTLAAVIVALLGLWVTARKAAQDQQEQFRELRARERREFLVEQLQRVTDLYAELAALRISNRGVFVGTGPVASAEARPHTAIAKARLHAHLAAVPGHYASLLKMTEFSESMQHFYTEKVQAEAQRRLAVHGADAKDVPDFMIYAELADNIAEVIGQEEAT